MDGQKQGYGGNQLYPGNGKLFHIWERHLQVKVAGFIGTARAQPGCPCPKFRHGTDDASTLFTTEMMRKASEIFVGLIKTL